MAESMKSSLPTNLQNSVDDKPSETGSGKKIAKPEDLVRIYDIILQVCNNFFFSGIEKTPDESFEGMASNPKPVTFTIFIDHNGLLHVVITIDT